MTIVDLDDNARIPAMPKQRPPARRVEDIPARWRERSDLVGYAACSRQGRPDGTMRYDICSDTFQNREQANNARKYLTQKRSDGVDFVVMEPARGRPMSTPKRIQLRRTKGWRKPEGAIVVARPSKWGNPFRVVRDGKAWTVIDDNGVDYREPYVGWIARRPALLKAVSLFVMDIELELAPYPPLSELRGHDLACWCPLDQPCHADVLLEIANGT